MTDNDRLLALDGGCVHPYRWTNNSRDQEGRRSRWYRCPECDTTGYALEGEEPTPAVGDGHELTLGEMVRLGLRCGCEVRFEHDRVRVIRGDYEHVWFYDDPHEIEAALRAALLAAAGAR